MKASFVSISTRLAAATILLGASFATYAASQCKGIEQNTCSASSECTWVDSYERKDGRTVSAHCKSKPSKKAASSEAAKPGKKG